MPSDDNALLEIVKSARLRGKDYMFIEQQYGIPAPRAEQIMKEHYQGRAAKLDPNEQRMLQLERMEGLIDVLTSMALMGNIKSAEVLIGLLKEISTLLGLNIEQQTREVTILTEQQSAAIFSLIKTVAMAHLQLVQNTIKDHAVLAAIEEKWDEVTDVSFSQGVEEVIEAELVE